MLNCQKFNLRQIWYTLNMICLQYMYSPSTVVIAILEYDTRYAYKVCYRALTVQLKYRVVTALVHRYM